MFVELGNTTIKVAQNVDGDTLMLERFATDNGLLERIASVSDAIVCAPVGQKHSEKLLGALRRRDGTVVISPEMLMSYVGDSYDTPLTLGIDRVLNLMGLEDDGVVVSCGTAITVDARIGGRPIWGAIMPGFATAAEGLHTRVPALPLVDIHHMPTLPSRSSVESVANGVIIGTARAAQAIALELASIASPHADLMFVLTGGDAAILERFWKSPPEPIIDELLIFAGMAKVAITGKPG